jgi:hypothetical protein
LAQKGIGFEALDNGVLSCDDPKRLQAISPIRSRYTKRREGLRPLDRTAEEYFQPCLRFSTSFDAITIEGPQSTRSGLEMPNEESRNVYESRLLSWCWFDGSLCLCCGRNECQRPPVSLTVQPWASGLASGQTITLTGRLGPKRKWTTYANTNASTVVITALLLLAATSTPNVVAADQCTTDRKHFPPDLRAGKLQIEIQC